MAERLLRGACSSDSQSAIRTSNKTRQKGTRCEASGSIVEFCCSSARIAEGNEALRTLSKRHAMRSEETPLALAVQMLYDSNVASMNANFYKGDTKWNRTCQKEMKSRSI